jgi:hypothetical protein
VSLSGLVLGAGIPERAPGRYSEPASAS